MTAERRGGRNKTITLSEAEIGGYLDLCPRSYPGSLPGAAGYVIYADAFEALAGLPDSFVDLLIADPPYNLAKIYAGKSFRKMSDGEYSDFTRRWLEAVRHTLKPAASVYVCCDWRTGMIVGNVLADFFTLRNRVTWQREKGRGAARNWKNSMEDIWFATVSPLEFTFNTDAVKVRRQVIAPYRVDGAPKDWVESAAGKFRDTFPSNFWDDISIPYWSMPENTNHPTQKPEKLFAKLVLASSRPGDLVLDPFLGSGTSAVVAKKLGRGFIGIEREAEYCAYAQKRLAMAELDGSIQGYTDGVFWERNTFKAQQREKSRPAGAGEASLFDRKRRRPAGAGEASLFDRGDSRPAGAGEASLFDKEKSRPAGMEGAGAEWRLEIWDGDESNGDES
ncbi:MAG: site-specific DNA-methyltransferase [Peptococcaceae bacterium]|nr:site-specific DNA-methyltransferase [Peptococcaceae bacterium]